MSSEEKRTEIRPTGVAGVGQRKAYSADVMLWIWIPYPQDEHVYLAQLGPDFGILKQPAKKTETVTGVLHISIGGDIKQKKIEAGFTKDSERLTWKRLDSN